jgi:CheY-like chemotaxis protein
MGGELLLDSTPNKGSTFYFDIPMQLQAYPSKFEPISNDNIHIAILLNKENSFVANHIARYFVKIGVNVDQITAITDTQQVTSQMTHFICFEKKLSDDLFTYTKQNNIKLLVVEENFLSLKKENLHGATLISQYTYFAETLYNFVDTKEIPKVLIVEDDDISIELLKTMLSSEYCKIDVANNGMQGLELLANALNKNRPYDIVYTDHSMPLLSGSEMLRKYNILEKEKAVESITTVSVSGDISNTKDLYDFDFFATKPFKKEEVVTIFSKTIQAKRSN